MSRLISDSVYIIPSIQENTKLLALRPALILLDFSRFPRCIENFLCSHSVAKSLEPLQEVRLQSIQAHSGLEVHIIICEPNFLLYLLEKT